MTEADTAMAGSSTPEGELQTLAGEIVALLSPENRERYLDALREVLGTSAGIVRVRDLISGDLSEDPAVLAYLENRKQIGSSGYDHEQILTMVQIMSNAASVAQQFLDNPARFGPEDANRAFGKLYTKYFECLRTVPDIERKISARGERLYSEAEKKRGSPFSDEDGKAFVRNDPLNILSDVMLRISGFSMTVQTDQRVQK